MILWRVSCVKRTYNCHILHLPSLPMHSRVKFRESTKDKENCKSQKLEDAPVRPHYQTFDAQASAPAMHRFKVKYEFQLPTSTLQRWPRSLQAREH
jgi:hypothetical protein